VAAFHLTRNYNRSALSLPRKHIILLHFILTFHFFL
jgi:hypothetical protein